MAFAISLVALKRLAVAEVHVELTVGLRLSVDPLSESMSPRVSRTMDEVDRPAIGESLLEHADGRGDADAGADESQRLGNVGRVDIACGRPELQASSFLERVQMVRDFAALLALHADAVLSAVAGSGEGVVAPLLLPIHLHLQTDELARCVFDQLLAVFWNQVKGGDELALHHLLLDEESARATPSSGCLGTLGIDTLLRTN
mmetsp:Transcript_17252/g.37783  ORF Transcript_17252/g.37783 Transcript_17252/m.37783 type:complete len:202 (-) Transcript_17252:487-1092(-)